MSMTAEKFQQLLDDSVGGSDERYMHPLNQEFTFTMGVLNALHPVDGRWFVDLVAMKVAPLYAKAWLAGEASVGVVKVEVFAPGQHAEAARVTLSLEDDVPVAFSELVEVCDFPVGVWSFYLGTDSAAPNSSRYLTNLYLPQEH
jgi:hypothetical protein